MKSRDIDVEVEELLELFGLKRWHAGLHNTT